MLSVIRQFWRLCVLRQGPESIPGQSWFVLLVLALNILTSMFVNLRFANELDALQTATLVTVTLATQALLIWGALYFKDLSHRFSIVLTAILGSDLLLTVLIGLTFEISRLLFDQVSPLLVIPFQIWLFSVIGFILHRALEVTWLIGILLALGITFMGVVVGQAAIT